MADSIANNQQDQDTPLARMKREFILRDYDSWLDAQRRAEHRLNQLHYWEVTLIAAFIAFFLSRGSQTLYWTAGLPAYFVIVFFAVHEARTRAMGEWISARMRDTEKELQDRDPAAFKKAMLSWTFRETMVYGSFHRDSFSEKLRVWFKLTAIPTVCALCSLVVIIWHGLLAAAVWCVIHFART